MATSSNPPPGSPRPPAIVRAQEPAVEAGASAQASAQPPSAPEPQVLLTILLKHHAGLVLDEVQARLKAADWWERFPIPGTRVVSWTVAMGLGQIVTLEVPPQLLGLVNLELERSAWGVFKTEVYASYDFVPVRERIKERVREGGQ